MKPPRLLAHLTVAAGLVLAGDPCLGDDEDLEEAARVAFEAVEMTKYERTGDGELDGFERERLEKNFSRQVGRHFDRDREPDRDMLHFVDSVDEALDARDYWQHVEGCPVCNPFLKSLLRGTGIPPIPFVTQDSCPPIANACHTPRGSCAMSQRGPVRYQCYCPTAFGPVWGVSGC